MPVAPPVNLNSLSLPALFAELSASGHIRRLFELARDEDVGAGDATSKVCIEASASTTALIRARAPGVLAGLATLPLLLDVFDPGVSFRPMAADGEHVRAGAVLGTLAGPTRGVLTVERTVLNTLSRLSGVATLTARYVGAAGTGRARVFDTRKTTPGLRALEKYAVRCGGGFNHRIGLFDAVLIKDNHLARVAIDALASRVTKAARAARAAARALRFIEVEVDSLDQLRAVLTVEPGLVDIVLLDNMAPAALAEAVMLRDRLAPGIELEASGGVTLETISAIAATGVDRISVGAITHSAAALDIALDIE
ncbi:MAG: carboxylating nicotinate-nucleotide diphosphorylase [Phycisphaerales bacterium]|nr:carboxylating nicotinate-nucleotide diphosphorylase [Phycisphaerales bacterium]